MSRGLSTSKARVIEVPVSDHCPVALSVYLPEDLHLPPATATAFAQKRGGRISRRGLYSSQERTRQ
ncbi:MAG: hypothetical protein GWM87_04660 [Xanthomonadales bacterium]|nr:hypothetical protein [Xanthomonadales bacterium]NIX12300.1 hypothetical protein [Xanthomonadales bacterium]